MRNAATAAEVDNPKHGTSPVWIDRLCIGLVAYVLVCATWMLTGVGGERVRHYVGLLADTPASLVAFIVTATTAHRLAPGTLRKAWACLASALGLYIVGTMIGVASWLHNVDPFPGSADFFYLAFFPFFMTAVGLMIRAAAVKIRWTQFLLDAIVLVAGFGAFFWFLIIRPAASSTELDMLKYTLSQL